MSVLANRIIELRSDLEQTQEEFAKNNGVSRSQQAKYETGLNEIPIDYLLQILKSTKANPEWLLHGVLPKYKKDISSNTDLVSNKQLPYYDIDVSAGAALLFSDHITETPVSYISIPAFDDCDFAINVWGDSMHPKYKNGDIIICKEIHDWKTFLQYGEVYLIVTSKDHQRFIKYIRRSERNGYLKMVSENPNHDAFDVPYTDIKRIYIVKGKVERNQI